MISLVNGCGDTHEEAIVDRDNNLKQLLDQASQKNLKLNKDKLKLRQDNLA